MKNLSMRKIALGAGYFRYEVWENEKVIAIRVARRDFVGAFVIDVEYKLTGRFKISKMFGREDLFEAAKLDIAKVDRVYAIAELTQ